MSAFSTPATDSSPIKVNPQAMRHEARALSIAAGELLTTTERASRAAAETSWCLVPTHPGLESAGAALAATVMHTCMKLVALATDIQHATVQAAGHYELVDSQVLPPVGRPGAL